MKFSIGILLVLSLLSGCNNGEPIVVKPETSSPPAGFFPVTDFIKGQIAEVKTAGVNPLLINTRMGKTDSSWVKIEQVDSLFAPFLTPLIDSANLRDKFSEKSFLDQTINAFTFTYDPIAPLPDTFPLQRWDVYIDPQKNTVSRIFMVKRMGNKIGQLTWQADKWCRLVEIDEGSSAIQKDVTIKWDF